MIGTVIDERELPGGLHLITIGGDVDLYAAPDLRERIDHALARGTDCLIVELSDGTIIDSTILGVLLAALRRLSTEGRSLRIVCSDPKLLRIFELTGLDRRFAIDPRIEDAAAGALSASA